MPGFEQWPYSKKVIVVTHKAPALLSDKVTIASGPPTKVVSDLPRQGLHHFYITGGDTIQHFLISGLIDEIIITQIPVILGEGIPLFGPLEHDIKLDLTFSKSFDNGFIQYKYEVVR